MPNMFLNDCLIIERALSGHQKSWGQIIVQVLFSIVSLTELSLNYL